MMKNYGMGASVAPSMMIRGVAVFKGLLDPSSQSTLVEVVRQVVADAPLFRPTTKRGQSMSVRMTSAGSVGWISDQKGYRYEPLHPSGVEWPPIPEPVLDIWRAVLGTETTPDSCLINFYGGDARMGMHQDRDETDLTAPVVSISLGDDALFRIGNESRGGSTESMWLHSGDVLVLAGTSRLLHHGIDRIRSGTSKLLPNGGRLNLTLRIAN